MFDLNPLALPDAWWQHLLMLVVSALIGYIIGYLSSRSVAARLEEELAELDAQLDGCHKALLLVDVPVEYDDLKLVEGIGPKIEELLNKEGIMTFRQLSESSFERLTNILRAAGPSFQIHDPGSWPRQGELAADGKWDELRTWQDELNKGRTT